MKTQTDIPLVILALVVIGVILLAIWNGSQVDAAAAQVNASVATGQIPEAAVMAGQVSGWLVKTALGMVALVVVAGVIAWARQWWKARNSKKWKSGPNAGWQKERAPREMSEGEMMRLLMLQQLTGSQKRPSQGGQQNPDDDVNIEF